MACRGTHNGKPRHACHGRSTAYRSNSRRNLRTPLRHTVRLPPRHTPWHVAAIPIVPPRHTTATFTATPTATHDHAHGISWQPPRRTTATSTAISRQPPRHTTATPTAYHGNPSGIPRCLSRDTTTTPTGYYGIPHDIPRQPPRHTVAKPTRTPAYYGLTHRLAVATLPFFAMMQYRLTMDSNIYMSSWSYGTRLIENANRAFKWTCLDFSRIVPSTYLDDQA